MRSTVDHEIEIQNKALLLLFIRLFQSHDQFVSYKYDHEI